MDTLPVTQLDVHISRNVTTRPQLQTDCVRHMTFSVLAVALGVHIEPKTGGKIQCRAMQIDAEV